MKSREEILDAMKGAKSWRETGLSVQDVEELFGSETQKERGTDGNAAGKIRALEDRIARLSESNKKLMTENKKLKGEK